MRGKQEVFPGVVCLHLNIAELSPKLFSQGGKNVFHPDGTRLMMGTNEYRGA